MVWRSFRKGLFQVHLWLALILCVPMVLIGISGSALLVQRVILEHSAPAAKATGARHAIPDIIAAAKTAAAVGSIATRVDLPQAEGAVATVRFRPETEDGPEFDFYVDPVSLKVLGQSEVVERGPILAFLITIHAFLAMPPPIGLPFVGFNGVIMTFMSLSGLVLWWPRRGQWARSFLVRRGARGFELHFDIHRAVGIWGLVVFLAVSLSGIYLTFPQTLGPYLRAHLPGGESVSVDPPKTTPATAPLTPEQAIARASAAVQNVIPTGLALPTDQKSYVVEFEPQGFGPSLPKVMVVMNSDTAEIDFIDDPRTYSFPEKVLNWQSLLHFGIGLSWVWTVLVFLSGLLPLVFVITGLTMWWKKRRPKPAG